MRKYINWLNNYEIKIWGAKIRTIVIYSYTKQQYNLLNALLQLPNISYDIIIILILIYYSQIKVKSINILYSFKDNTMFIFDNI